MRRARHQPPNQKWEFQLTHSRGVRPAVCLQCQFNTFISTHALTWSATRNFLCTFIYRKFQLTHSRGVRPGKIDLIITKSVFQLTHSRGVRHILTLDMRQYTQFQLTHSRGVRHLRDSKNPWQKMHFNSRTHVECDLLSSA